MYDELVKIATATKDKNTHRMPPLTKAVVGKVEAGLQSLDPVHRKPAEELRDAIGAKALTAVLHHMRRWYSNQTGPNAKQVLARHDALAKAMQLDTLPDLYRGFKLDNKSPLLQGLKEGDSITIPVTRNQGFSSWTVHRDIANKFSGASRGKTGLVIKLQGGEAIKPVIAPPEFSQPWFNALYEQTMGPHFRKKEGEYVLQSPQVTAEIIAIKTGKRPKKKQ